jgi:alkaline phosphatase
MDCLSKEEFLAHAQSHGKAKGKAYYAFTVKGMRFIVLDANHNKDMSPYCRGNFKWTSAWIPEEQKEWLRSELKANAERPVVVFIHQLLDSFSDISRKVCVGNADEIRDILEQHGQVLAVFQGHHHPGHYSRKSGIHYVTLKGAIEGPWPDRNSFAIVEARPDGSMKLEGWKDCPDMQLYRQKDNI